jgi:hypothetical protein
LNFGLWPGLWAETCEWGVTRGVEWDMHSAKGRRARLKTRNTRSKRACAERVSLSILS